MLDLIVKTLGGPEIYEAIPKLVLTNPPGDYIDNVKPADMEFPVMQGIDKDTREFLAVKVNLVNKETGVKSQAVGTFFERYNKSNQKLYKNNKVEWAYGTFFDTGLIHHDSRVEPEYFETLEARLTLLFGGKQISSINRFTATGLDLVHGNGDYLVSLA